MFSRENLFKTIITTYTRSYFIFLATVSFYNCVSIYLSESCQPWQWTQVAQSSAVKSLSTGRSLFLCKLFTYVNNWVRGWAHSHHCHPLPHFWAHLVQPNRLATAIWCTAFISWLLNLNIWSPPRTCSEAGQRRFLFFHVNRTPQSPVIMSQFKPWSFF